jgi:hypothetical protein
MFMRTDPVKNRRWNFRQRFVATEPSNLRLCQVPIGNWIHESCECEGLLRGKELHHSQGAQGPLGSGKMVFPDSQDFSLRRSSAQRATKTKAAHKTTSRL